MNNDVFSLKGKLALVTGGSRGIGFGIARGLAGAGADLILVARDQDRLASARTELSETGVCISTVTLDLGDSQAIDAAYRGIVTTIGAADILVNAAGVTRRGPAEGLALADWQHVLDVNLTSVFAFCQAFARERIESGSKGRIINIASLMSEGARRDNAPYAASKGGIRQLTKALAVEWAGYGINVNAIGPGYVRTDLTRAVQQDEALDRWVVERTPLGRWGEPGDLAGAAVFLASEVSDFVTGQVIYVDGGWLASL